MKALLINAVCGIRSTGRIVTNLAKELEDQGYEVKIAYGRGTVPQPYEKYAVRIGNTLSVCWHALMTRLFDGRGFWSKLATKKFLKWAEDYQPDLLWLHNIHDHFIDVEQLFSWIKKHPEMQVKWTQHDCWSFTGQCSHFMHTHCEQWKTHCKKCPAHANYPYVKLMNCPYRNFERRKKAFCGVKNMTLITPSQWLADLVKQSFLKEYPVEVIHNTIDTQVFKPTEGDFREKYHLEDKIIVLGVAQIWTKEKGLYDYYQLKKMLGDRYAVVLVGLTKKQLPTVPKDILGLPRTNSPRELAEIYTTADVFLNLTYEDNYPTVNLESQACGTPCITYRTGGSPESVPAENVFEPGDLASVKKRILELTEKK